MLLVHSGEFARGKAELQAYASSPAAKKAPVETRLLVDRLMDLVDNTLERLAPDAQSTRAKPDAAAITTIENVLKLEPPPKDEGALLDLPW